MLFRKKIQVCCLLLLYLFNILYLVFHPIIYCPSITIFRNITYRLCNIPGSYIFVVMWAQVGLNPDNWLISQYHLGQIFLTDKQSSSKYACLNSLSHISIFGMDQRPPYIVICASSWLILQFTSTISSGSGHWGLDNRYTPSTYLLSEILLWTILLK